MSEWRSIDTAPRDGRTLILAGDRWYGARVGRWDRNPLERRCGWCVGLETLDEGAVRWWQPLPTPPGRKELPC